MTEATRTERWTRLAWIPLAALLAGAVYLGQEPGGTAPVLVYEHGPFWVSLVALVALLAALGHSALHRPFLRPGRARALALLGFAFGAAWAPFSYPTSWAGRPSTVPFRLPFEGEWTVRCGGRSWHHNALAFQPSRCRGFDFTRRVDGRAYPPGAGGEGLPPLELWYGYRAAVLAPAAGRVVAVHDGEPDLAPGASRAAGGRLGNHVVLEVAPRQFLFLSHLSPGSIEVAVGERVAAGELLAAVGSSGQPIVAADPHLGVHLQDTPEPRLGEGIPFAFRDYTEDGRPVERGIPEGGLGLRGELSGALVRPSTESPPATD